MPEPDDTDREIIAWLARQPEGAVIAWYSHHLPIDNPHSFSWVDITVASMREELALNWCFTVVAPEDPDEGCDLTTFAWPTDHIVNGTPAWSPEAVSSALTAWTAKHADRLDITYVWQPRPADEPADDIIDQLTVAGDEPYYQVSDNVMVDPKLMELMRSDPAAAADIIAAAQRIAADLPKP